MNVYLAVAIAQTFISLFVLLLYKLSLWQESENGKNFLKKLDEKSLAQDNKSAS